MQPQPIFTEARTFLAAVLPWGEDWNNLHWTTDRVSEKTGKPFWDGRAYKTFDQMIGGLNWLAKTSARDVYVCMSSQLVAEEKISQKGFPYHKADRSAEAAIALKSIFMDVDVKKGAYENTDEALTAFLEFVLKYKLPNPSALVASGSGGFHAHWILDQPVPRDEWLVLAHALAYIIKESGMHADAQCTIDCARILRVPNTLNYKHEPPKPVSLMIPAAGEEVKIYTRSKMEEVLKAWIGLTRIQNVQSNGSVSALPRRPAIVSEDELGGGIESGMLSDLQLVKEHCPLIANTLASYGANLTGQPQWFLMAGIAQHTKEGLHDFYRLSVGNPYFKQEDADALFARVKKDGKGWIQCKTFKNAGCKECMTCPLLAEDKSPLHYGIPKRAELLPPVTYGVTPGSYGHLPASWSYSATGIVQSMTVQEDGTILSAPLLDYPMMNAWVEEDPCILHFDTVTSNRKHMVNLHLEHISSKDQFPKMLARHGMAVSPQRINIVREFMVSWVRRLQGIKETVIQTAPFGWVHEGPKLLGFSYGGTIFTPTGQRVAANADPTLASQYKPTGDIVPWMDAANLITSMGRQELCSILAASFGAPLVTFTHFDAALISGYSAASGVGKSTAMKAALAVWGHPVEAMQQLTDTATATTIRMDKIKSLPLFWDEIKGTGQAEKFVNLIFQITSGKGSARAQADLTLRKVGSWQTLVVTTNNFSLQDPVQAGSPEGPAGLYRLYEFEVPEGNGLGDIGTGKAQRIIGALKQNYGTAGLLYSQFLGENHERIAKEMADAFDEFNGTILKANNSERFWVTAVVTTLMGAKYANEIGLTNFDLDLLAKFLIGNFLRLRRGLVKNSFSVSESSSVKEILAAFLTEQLARNTITTDHMHIGGGRPAIGAIQARCDLTKIITLNVHYAEDDKRMLIRCQALSEWIREKRLPERQITDTMESKFGITKSKRKLGSGAALSSAQQFCYEVDLTHPELVDLI